MARLKIFRHQFAVRLRASSLLEAIVASVVFLLVFAISLETLTRLATGDKTGRYIVSVDNQIQNAIAQCTSTRHETGAAVRHYPWGTIRITVAAYGNNPALQSLTISAQIDADNRRIEFRQLIAPSDEPVTHLSMP